MGKCTDIEFIERIKIAGSIRYRFKIRSTGVILNVEAPTQEEARIKAQQMAERLFEC